MESEHELLGECVREIARASGLDLAVDRPASEAILRRIAELGLSGPGEYLERLRDSGTRAVEIASLAPLLTVGETYFMRDRAQLEAIVQWALRLAANRPGHVVRIWSAGCSTGEEPYSIAMLLEEARVLRNETKFLVVATDINEQVIEKAREGVYSGRSVNRLDSIALACHFARSGSAFSVRQNVRERVRFYTHNLASSQPVPSPDGVVHFDVIVCRNVAIHLGRDTFGQLLERFGRLLREDGVLFVGHGELLLHPGSPFEPLRTGDVFAYVKSAGPLLRTSSTSSRRPLDELGESGERAGPARPAPDARPSSAGPRVPRKRPPGPEPRSIRGEDGPRAAPALEPGGLAPQAAFDRSDYSEAVRLCRNRLALDPIQPEILRLFYQSLLASGRNYEAMEILGKLLYLEPADAASRFMLARFLAREGDFEAAHREYDNVLRTLAGRDPAAEVPGSDGMTHASMARLCREALSRSGE